MKRALPSVLICLLVSAASAQPEEPDSPPCIVTHAQLGWEFRAERNADRVTVMSVSPSNRFVVTAERMDEPRALFETIRFATGRSGDAHCARQEADVAVRIDGADFLRETRRDLCEGAELRYQITREAPYLQGELADAREVTFAYHGRDPSAPEDRQSLGGFEVSYQAPQLREVLGVAGALMRRVLEVHGQGGCATVDGSITLHPGP